MKEVALVFLLSTLVITERTPKQLLYSPLLFPGGNQNGVYRTHQITPYYSFWLNAAARPVRGSEPVTATATVQQQQHYHPVQLQVLPLSSHYYAQPNQHNHQPYWTHAYQLPAAWNQLTHFGQQQQQQFGHQTFPSNYYLQHHQHPQQIWQVANQQQQSWELSPNLHKPHQQQHNAFQQVHQETQGQSQVILGDDSEIVEAAPEDTNHLQHDQSQTTAVYPPPRDFSNYNFDFSNLRKPVQAVSTVNHLGFQRGHVEFELDGQNKANSYVNNDNKRGKGGPNTMTIPADTRNAGEWNELTKPEDNGGGFNRGAVEARASTSFMSWKDRFGLTTYQNRQESYRVVCYFANWGWFRDENAGRYEPEYVDPTLCTHMIYAYASYDRNTISIKPSEPTVDVDNRFYDRVVKLKERNPKLKVLLAVGGWADSYDSKYSSLASSEANRRKFAREAVNYLRKYGFDGISIDWHYPVCWQSDCQKGPKSDKDRFSDLIYELKTAFAPEGYLVVASLSGYKEVIDAAYDVPKISQYLDFMNIMTYDYHGSWESRTGHLSPLFAGPQAEDLKRTYNSDFTMEYYVSKGADASKLILGIPLYGQSFTLENPFDSSLGSLAVGPGKPGDFTRQEGMLAYYEICRAVREQGWKVRKGTTGSHGPYAHKGDQWVGYDDVEFVKRKALYVKTKSFGGAFVFTLDLDDYTNVCCGGDHPLLRTLADELLSIPFNSRKQGCTGSETTQPTTTSPIIRPTPPPQVPDNINTQAPTDRPSEACQYSSRPHPTKCNSYYVCNSGMEFVQVCPAGLHYNPSAMACDWPANAGCMSNQPTLSPSTMRPTTRPTTQRPTMTQPPTTMRPPETDAPPPAPGGSNYCYSEGEYTPATNCDQYYLCSNGINKLQTCGPGLHWNNEKKLCDWPSEARCQLRHDGPGPNPGTGLGSPQADASCQDGTIAGSPDECDVYYVCVHGKYMKFRCQGGLHWNANANVCDWPYNVNCQANQVTEGPVRTTTTTAPPSWAWPPTPSTTNPPPQSSTIIPPSLPPFVPQYPDTTKPPVIIEYPEATEAPPAPPMPPQYSTTSAPPLPPQIPDTTLAPSGTDLSGDYMIVCYFTNWAWYRPGVGKYKPEDINSDLCTHIVYGFAVLDSDQLTIKPHDTWADIDNRFYEQVTALKRKGKKVTVAIGGWNDSLGDKYSRLVANPAARKRFINHVIEFIKSHNFDGLDLDWEYPKCWQVECNKGPDSDKPNFAAFVRELSEAFKPYNFLLSSAVSPSKTVIDAGYDVPTISRYMDWIAVMAYDFHGQWDKKTGHVAPLYFHEEDDFYYFNANYSVNYWINQGADRRKIVMGMPMYGQSFTLANPAEHGLNAPSIGGGTAGEYTRASGFLSGYEICHNIQKNGWTVVKDETGAMGPYAYKGNQWVSYDDVEMIRKKSELIRKLGLGGGMIWALDLDDFRNTCGGGPYPLLSTIKSVLGRGKSISEQVESVQWVQDKPIKQEVAVVYPVEKPTPAPTTSSERPPLKQEEIEHCTEPFKKHENDCSKYYQCVFGRYIEQKCPPGTMWNKDRCDWPGNTDCGNSALKTTTPPPLAIQTTSYKPPPQQQQQQTTMWTLPPAPSTSTSWTNPPVPASSSSSSGGWTQPSTASTTQNYPVDVTYPSTSFRPNRRTTTPTPTKDPEWCKLNWCPTPKPIPPNKHTPMKLPPSDYKVVCYFTNWAWYRQGAGKYKPEDVNFNLCTHIIYGFAVLNPSTLVIRPHDDWADIDNQFYKQVTQLREKGVIVMLALGGWNDSLGDKYSKLVNDPGARARFIDHAITFIEEWDFDGLDLDWEYPKCWQVDCEKGPDSDKPAFATFVREIKEAFEPRGLLLSSAVSPNHKVIDQGYDVPTVSRYLDWIAVMTYDYHGQFDGKTGHNSPMYAHPDDDNQKFNTNFTINYWIENGADRKKIVMGMPMYGQSFTLVNTSNTGLNSKSSGGAEAGEYTRSKGFLAYYEICNYVQQKGWTMVQDPLGTMGPYAYKGDQWVSFDDIDQIRRKSEYIKSMRLGGGMIWALDLDDFRGNCGCEEHPLLKTINRVLRNYPEPDPKCRF